MRFTDLVYRFTLIAYSILLISILLIFPKSSYSQEQGRFKNGIGSRIIQEKNSSTIPEQLATLQANIHRLIEKAEPAIACISISRSEQYRNFTTPKEGAKEGAASPGKLGIFDARSMRMHMHHLNQEQRELINKLDLSSADSFPESYGSGVVIHEKGLILTNYHVVRGAKKIYVRLPGGIGSYADILAADGRSDLAILKMIQIPPQLPVIPFGDGDKLHKGDFVLSIANPFAIGFQDGGASVSWGIISNLNKKAPKKNLISDTDTDRNRPLQEYSIMIQTDTKLCLGCSGGAILNMEGKLIGLSSATAGIIGGEKAGGFALPMSSNIKRMIAVLERGEEVEYGLLGISIARDFFGRQSPFSRNGIRIQEATAGLPAARSGLRRGDTIIAINDEKVNEFDDLFLAVGAQLAGTKVTLQVLSPTGDLRRVNLELAKANPVGESIVSKKTEMVMGLSVDYTSILMQSTDINLPMGVLVRELIPNSIAGRKLKPIKDGDRIIIQKVNDKTVLNPKDFYTICKGLNQLKLEIIDLTRDPESTRRTIYLP